MQTALMDTRRLFNTPNPGDGSQSRFAMVEQVSVTRRLTGIAQDNAMNRRALPRYPIHIEGRITTPEQAGKPCTIRDFNENGMFIRCESDSFELLPGEDQQLRAGDPVEVVFQMPGRAARVKVRARVVRVIRSVFEDGLGIFFAKCNDTILQALIREAENPR